MLILSLLIGCKSDDEPEVTTSTIPDGILVLETPGDLAWMADGPAQVSGLADNIDSLTLNNLPVTITDSTFSESVTLSRGINHLVAVGVDVSGDTITERATVLAGDFASPGNPMSDVLSVHLGQAGLNAIETAAASALDPSLLLDKEGTINPIYSNHPIVGSWLDADLIGLSFSTAEISTIPTGGALEATIILPELVIDIDSYGEVAWIDYSMDVQMTADAAVITAEIMIEVVDGELEVLMVDPEIELQGFAYDLSILPNFIEGYFFVETIQGTIEDMLVEQANEMVPTMIDEALTGLTFATTLDLLGTELSIAAEFADVNINTEGVELDMDVNVVVPGSGSVSYAGYLVAPDHSTPQHNTDDPLSLLLSDDLINRSLFELWRGGALSMMLSTEDGSLDPTTIDGYPLDSATIQIQPQLPPVLVNGESDLQLQLQAGAIDVSISTPGATFGENISLRMTMIADFSIAVSDDMIQPQLGEISLDIEVLESDWAIPNSSVSELVEWALPQEDLIIMVSEMSIALPSLGGITISSAAISHDEDTFHSAISVDFAIE